MKRRSLMKCGLAVCAVLLISFCSVSCRKPPPDMPKVRVLFVGNSLTYANDLPGLTAELARSRNIKMDYEQYAPGGYTLSQHSKDPQLLEKINKGDWDFVVLQEQSQMPAYPWAQTEVMPYARKLAESIRAANPRAQLAFYMTMARRDGMRGDAAAFPELGTYEGMQRKLNESYVQMAKENQGILVPVGPAWAKSRSQDPSLNLYADDVHPNLIGTYLAACVFYSVLFKDSPIGLTHPQPINENTSGYLQKVASETITGLAITANQ